MGGYSLGLLSSHQVGHLRVLPGRVDVRVSVLVLMRAAALLAWNFLFTAPARSVSETGHSWVSLGHAWLSPGLPA